MSVLRNERVRGWLWQLLLVLALLGLGAWLIGNTLDNLASRNIRVGFGFLSSEAGFEIAESALRYGPSDSYGRALAVGVANTLRVAALGIVIASVLGFAIGIARLSRNWLLARLAGAYVETLRNIPLLLQLFVWYGLLTEWLPPVRQALSIDGWLVLSQRGLRIAWPLAHPGWSAAGYGLLAALLLGIGWRQWVARRQRLSGHRPPLAPVLAALLLGGPMLGWWLGGAPSGIDAPVLRGFNHQGGIGVSPEFAALTIGLATYTAAFIAEVVRAGLRAVDAGQTDAAMALGLSRGQRLRLVVMPQALRAILPPLTNQYLNLAKNSSLAVAIGYPDLVSISNTMMNQTGQAIEAITILMAVYLTISLSIALATNLYGARVRWGERR